MEMFNVGLQANVEVIGFSLFWLFFTMLFTKGIIDVLFGKNEEILNRDNNFDFD